MGIKIITFADIHVGVTTYGQIEPNTGLNTRVINALQSLDATIDYAIENKIEYIIIPGDVYKNNLPSPTIQNEFNIRMKRASDNNINIYIMDGNHDVSMIKTAKSALDTFKTLKVNNVYTSKLKKTYYLDNLKILMLPTYCNQQEIEDILEEETKENIPTLIAGHLTLKGAKLNDWLIEQNENAIDVEIFKRPNIIGVILGHLHKYQILNYNPLIYYTGSLQRIDFTEEKQEKGFVVLDIDGYNIDHTFVEIPSQEFFTLDMDLRESANEMNDVLEEIIINKAKLKNSIVRLRLKLNKGNNLQDNIIIQELCKYEVAKIASIQKEFDKENIVRNKDITDNITVEKALDLYFKDNEFKDELVSLGLELIKKLEG